MRKRNARKTRALVIHFAARSFSMNTQLQSILEKYQSMSSAARISFLISTSFHLTIESRHATEFDIDKAAKMYAAANEIQHRLLGQARNESKGLPSYPADALFNIFDEISARHGISGHIASAMTSALKDQSN